MKMPLKREAFLMDGVLGMFHVPTISGKHWDGYYSLF